MTTTDIEAIIEIINGLTYGRDIDGVRFDLVDPEQLILAIKRWSEQPKVST